MSFGFLLQLDFIIVPGLQFCLVKGWSVSNKQQALWKLQVVWGCEFLTNPLKKMFSLSCVTEKRIRTTRIISTPVWLNSNWDCCISDWRKTHRPLETSEWRHPHHFLHSSPLMLQWRRSSSAWLWQCPPWPGPGRCLGAPPGRRSHSGCYHSAQEPWRHNSPEESVRHDEKQSWS